MVKRANPTTLVVVSVLLVGIHCATATGRLIYVDATVYGNGTSWANAYMHLRDALDAAEPNDEIRVADGVYRPSNLTDPNDVRTATYQLKNGVAIYGGYAGHGAPDPDERNVALYVSELSGDVGFPDVNADNCYHVVIGSGTDATAILDGFTITDANANGLNSPDDRGGGMYNEGGSPTVANCTFIANRVKLYGGGMCNFFSSNPTLTNCTFNNNSADDGGGAIFNYDSSPTVTDCNFSANSANDGGAMENNQSSPTLTNCTFTENDANNDGGAMYNDNATRPISAGAGYSTANSAAPY
ncbi:MAG: right-handed parallel beta-helix repeat-containing protein [Planctomycetota bacterium]